MPPGEFLAVPHQEPDSRRRGEDAGDALALDDRPDGIGVGVVDGTLVREGRGTCHQRRVDDVAVADDPADVGRGPPRLALTEPEHPVAHRCDVNRVAAMGVHGELWLGGGAGRGEDERGIGSHRVLGRARLAVAGGEEFVPRQLTVAWRPGRVRASDDDHVLDVVRGGVERGVDQSKQVHVTALPVRDVAREQQARTARPDAFAECAGTEAGEHDTVYRPDPHGREHGGDRLRGRRHVDREAVALADAEAAQARGDPLDLGEQLGVGQGAAATTFIESDEGDLIATPGGDVPIQRVDGHVGPPAGKPAEGRRVGLFERSIGRARPVEALRFPQPEGLGIVEGASIEGVVPGSSVGHDLRSLLRVTLVRYALLMPSPRWSRQSPGAARRSRRRPRPRF